VTLLHTNGRGSEVVEMKKMSPAVLRFSAEMLKTLGHPIRLQILEVLEEFDEMSVFRIQELLSLPQPVTSQHLNKMRVLGLLDSRREGGCVLYRLSNPQIKPLLRCLRQSRPDMD